MLLPVIMLVALIVGVLIGTVGVGGVALPPFLTWFAGFDPHTAAGTSSWAFLFTGVVGTVMYARQAEMSWPFVRRLTLGIAPGALVGAFSNQWLPDAFALMPLAVLVTGAGLLHLRRLARPYAASDRPISTIPTPRIVTIGLLVGFASALTGTGGPVFLIPALLMLRVPALPAIAASQVVQIPLTFFAVVGYAQTGAINIEAGTLIGAIAAVGVVIGAWTAVRLPPKLLSRITGSALTGFGVTLLVTTFAAL